MWLKTRNYKHRWCYHYNEAVNLIHCIVLLESIEVRSFWSQTINYSSPTSKNEIAKQEKNEEIMIVCNKFFEIHIKHD